MPVNIKWKEDQSLRHNTCAAYLGAVRVGSIRRGIGKKYFTQVSLPLPDGNRNQSFDSLVDAKGYIEAKIMEFIALTGLTQEGVKRPLSDMEQMLDIIAGKKVSNG